MYDILYLVIKESEDNYGHEEDYGVILNYDYITKEFVGADIWDFKKRIANNEIIKLPVNIDLKEIYNQLS
ncbi:MAG: hypothetical protein FIA99_05485 [Ruminiclostridium sp.]|nr:hypothetical protein [Ruminiclostridium sp.]